LAEKFTPTVIDGGKIKIMPFRHADEGAPSDEMWQQARAKSESVGIKFGVVLVEDYDGALCVIPINVESQIHAEAMLNQAQGCFIPDGDDD
jgi:hypothetical protein